MQKYNLAVQTKKVFRSFADLKKEKKKALLAVELSTLKAETPLSD